MGEGAPGRTAQEDKVRPGATPVEFPVRNHCGFDRPRASSTVRASGLVRSLNKALRNPTPPVLSTGNTSRPDRWLELDPLYRS
jgi:hypothetical protein